MFSGRSIIESKIARGPAKKFLFKFLLRRCVQYAVSRHMGGGPRAKQYAVSRFMFENLAGPTIIFDPMTLRPENTSIGCYSTVSRIFFFRSGFKSLILVLIT